MLTLIYPPICNKVSDVPHLAQSLFLGKMWNFYFERPGLAFNLMMRILVSKTFTLPSAIPTTGWLAKAWMANPLEGPPDAFRHHRNGPHCTGKGSKEKRGSSKDQDAFSLILDL